MANTKKKKFQELDLNNGFLFSAALADPETCALVLELILGRPIGKIYVEAEHTALFSSDFRSVRFDIFADEDGALEVRHNIEMQNQAQGNLPERVRFHQAELDITGLQPGESFKALKPTYIIFICTFDPFGKKLYRYTVEKHFQENGERYEDDTHVIFLNTKGQIPENVPEVLVEFLKYVEHSTGEVATESGEDRICKLHEKIQRLKASRKWEERYMTLEDMMLEREEEGRQEGIQEGLQAGRQEGIQEGMMVMLISMVQYLLCQEMNSAQISKELKKEKAAIDAICAAIKQCGPDAQPEEIYEVFKNESEADE